jgi:Mce-associated membrane protein
MSAPSRAATALKEPEVMLTEIEADDDVLAGVVETAESVPEPTPEPRRARSWPRLVAYGLLPAVALLLAMVAGFLKWQDLSVRQDPASLAASLQAATDGTIALLSYQPDTVEQDLEVARSRLTGQFLDAYTSLTRDVVIPGAKQQQITAVASVPAGAPVSVSGSHAVALLFVNQSVTVGQDPPSNTASSVRVTLDKVDGRWLISGFEPV